MTDSHMAVSALAKMAQSIPVLRFHREDAESVRTDQVAVEEPLELRLEGKPLAVIMRTPGHDRDLAAGFAFTEQILRSPSELLDIVRCSPEDKEGNENMLDVRVSEGHRIDWARLSRHVYTSSSCGVCSKTTLASVLQQHPVVEAPASISAGLILTLPSVLRESQATFASTGGLHASALFTMQGRLLLVREDVGRHNALDKLIGHFFRIGALPLRDCLLLLSGRISFELMQKAHAAGIPVVAGISAPSSMAVALARQSGQVLIGFLREGRFNVYAGEDAVQNIPAGG